MTENEILENAPEVQEVPKTRRKKKNKLVRKIVYFGLLAIFVSVFIYCAVYIANYAIDSHQTNNQYNDLASQIDKLREENAQKDPDKTPTDPTGNGGEAGTDSEGNGEGSTPETVPSNILPEYQDLYAMNSDLVGWIKVPGTKVDYPVMQTPDTPHYYLDHDFFGEKKKWGAIYVREACDIFTPCDNVVIYGHRMNDGSMFAGLFAYEKKAYWEENQYITFDTIYERHTYQIIAVFKTTANPGEGFAYHVFNTAKDEADFNNFISTVHDLQMYDTGITAEYGDMLITLSTCTPRHQQPENGRFVVVAKRVS